jgi:hypothetical protein
MAPAARPGAVGVVGRAGARVAECAATPSSWRDAGDVEPVLPLFFSRRLGCRRHRSAPARRGRRADRHADRLRSAGRQGQSALIRLGLVLMRVAADAGLAVGVIRWR